jgi:hypothetical protein
MNLSSDVLREEGGWLVLDEIPEHDEFRDGLQFGVPSDVGDPSVFMESRCHAQSQR